MRLRSQFMSQFGGVVNGLFGADQTLAQRLAALGARLIWPSSLTDDGVLATVFGDTPTWSDTPIVTPDGVDPSGGLPTFTVSDVDWSDSGTLRLVLTAQTASADIVGTVQVLGPLYATSAGLVLDDGANQAIVTASWAAGDEVTVIARVVSSQMSVSVITSAENYALWSDDITGPIWEFYGSIAALETGYLVTSRAAAGYVCDQKFTGLTPGKAYVCVLELQGYSAPLRTILMILNSSYSSIAATDYINFAPIENSCRMFKKFTAPSDGVATLRLTKDADTSARILFRCRLVQDTPVAIYANGDSTTMGSFSSGGISLFNAVSMNVATSLNCLCVNNSTGGDRLDQIYTEMQTDLASAIYPIIIVGGGLNDIFQQWSSGVAATMLPSAENILALAAQKAQLVLFLSINEYGFESQSREWVVEYNSGLMALCAQYGAIYIDVADVLSKNGAIVPECYTVDTFHYNSVGSARVAQLCEAVIRTHSVAYPILPDHVVTTTAPGLGGEYEKMSQASQFAGTMPDLTLSADSPAALKSMQAWTGTPSVEQMEMGDV